MAGLTSQISDFGLGMWITDGPLGQILETADRGPEIVLKVSYKSECRTSFFFRWSFAPRYFHRRFHMPSGVVLST
ncbi:hypothetical protein Pelo_15211 [Pelomyxa schiedti]|nr:hypothetical protein Pelo_15211 [Pelomyxa schiedti]